MALTVNKNKPYVVGASTTEGTITLDRDREYTIKHNGLNASGSATDPIFFAYDEAVTASWAQDDNKFGLNANELVSIGPGCETLHYKTAAGTPTFSLIPGPKLLGEH